MSLLTDDDYHILQLRLAYLRLVDDHVGPRVISVSDIANLPAHLDLPDVRREQTNRSLRPLERVPGDKANSLGSLGVQGLFIQDNEDSMEERGDSSAQDSILPRYRAGAPVLIAGLNDAQLYPELTTLYSPRLASDFPHFQDVPSGESYFAESSKSAFNAANAAEEQRDGQRTRSTSLGAGSLKYTTTIYGAGRTGALGMRVTGRHNNTSNTPSRRRSKDFISNPGAFGTALNMSRAATMMPSRGLGTSGKRASTRRASDQSERSTSTSAFEGEQAMNPRMQIPELSIQASTYESDEDARLNKRSTSLREASHTHPSDAAALADSRRRSSSQPYRPGLPSGLANVAAAGDTIATTDQPSNSPLSVGTSGDGAGAHNEEVVSPRVVRATVPPRPPRKPRTSISDQSASSTSGLSISRVMSEDGIMSGQNGVSQQIDGRPRSQSEAIIPGSMPVETQSGMRERSKTDTSGPARLNAASLFKPYIPTTNSGSTLFSLASPTSARRGGQSVLSQQSDGSAPSLDQATGEQYYQNAMFEPVAEDMEGASNGELVLEEVVPDTSHLRGRASSDPRDALGKNRRAQREVFLSPLRAQKSFGQMSQTTDGAADDEGESPIPVPTSSEAAIAPILTAAVGPDRRSMNASVTPVLSSMDTSNGAPAEEKSKRNGEPGRSGDLLRRSPSFFLKENPAAVKKLFETRSNRSALSALISNRSEGPSNLFDQYKSVAGSAVATGNITVVELYFPFASKSNPVGMTKPVSGALALNPSSRSMRLSVRKDATMEELIGYGLYCYAEEDWRPRLADALSPDASEEEREVRMSTVAWTLRIVEDGEVDDDYPAVDRSLTVGKFGADELAVCEATPAQIKQNQQSSSLLGKRVMRQRQMSTGLGSLRPPNIGTLGRPSLTSPARHGTTTSAATNLPQIDSNTTLQGTPVFGMSVVGPRGGGTSPGGGLPSGSGAGGRSERPYLGVGMPIFLRVLVTPNPDVRYKTTLQVTSDRYLADVLETICKRRELGNAEKWAFMVPEKDIVVPLDRTVESLQGAYDLVLVRRQDLGAQRTGALTTQSSNPNASIFKRTSQPANPHGREIASVYKSYTVNRRMPTFLGRHERILTIDGDWLHIIPTDTRAFQSHTATTSYPISSIISCTQSRATSSFKLIVMRENDQKRYDFEAESSKAAAEIVQEINALLRRK